MKPIAALLLLVLLTACNVNSSVSLAEGQTHEGDLTTVNGSVSIGADSQLDGDGSTVNGSIRVGDRAVVNDVASVNGSVTIGDDVQLRDAKAVNGSIVSGSRVSSSGIFETLNGRIEVGPDSVVEGGIGTANGDILVRGAEVGRITTGNGDITLEANSRVNGEILVERPRRFNEEEAQAIRVEIGANSTVVGPLRFEREVELRIHQSATVGEIIGAEPVYFDE